MKKNKIFLIDAMALIYRAHFAFIRSPRITSKGKNTSAIFGFTNSLLEIIQKEKPTHILAAFDSKEPTFRHKEFETYKANRDNQPEAITEAIPEIKDILKAFNIPIFELPGYEADDIIGTIAHKLQNSDFEVYIMTPDKDFAQLVKDNIYIYKPGYMQKNSEILDQKTILKKWGISNTEQIKDILGLWGDSIDNIPGVPGIGEKTSTELIQKYHSIENLLKNLDKLKGRVKENLEKYSKQALDSKKLATISLDVPIKFDKSEAEYKGQNKEELIRIFQELEFKTILKRLFGISPEQKIQISMFDDSNLENIKNYDARINNLKNIKTKYQIINTINKLQTLINNLSKQSEISIKTFASDLNPHKAKLIGLAVAFKEKESFYIHFPSDKKDYTAFVYEINKILNNKEITKISHDIKYDIIILSNHSIELQGKLIDLMLAHYLIEPDLNHDLITMAKMYLQYEPIENKLFEKEKINNTDLNQIKEYICECSDIILQLKNKLLPKLQIENVENLFWNVEMPTAKVLAKMEMNGVSIDTNILAKLSINTEKELQYIEKQIYKLAKEEFKINSPKQLGIILFEKLKLLENPTKTKSGQYATGEPVLIKLIDKHSIVENILNFKGLSKLKSTYIDALPNMISKKDNKIHTTYNQAIVATGRLSSTDPNLQNIPIKNEAGKQIREAFIPRNPDYQIMSADYSQIELRIMASFANEAQLINAFKEDKDIHILTATKIFGVNEKDVTPEMRSKAKTVNFGILYGISGFGLAKIIEIKRSDAYEMIDAYFKKFPDIKNYMDLTIEKAREDGYVKTLMGRKRILDGINSRNATIRKFAERNAINSPIQGTQAEMIKIAMVNINNWMEENKMKSKMTMQVHDELVFDLYREEKDIMIKNVEQLMKSAIKLKLPIKVNIQVGNNWREAH